MYLKNTEKVMFLMRKLILILGFFGLLSILGGCSSISLKMSYSPTYTEKRALVESTITSKKPITVLLLKFKDKRNDISDPFLIYKRVSLEDKSLSEYLYASLLNDIEMMGFDVAQVSNIKLDIKEIESGNETIDDAIQFVLAVDINQCIPDYNSGFSAIQPYSTFDFYITIWDNRKSKIVYNKRLFREIMGVETSAATFKDMVIKLLNEDLTVINVDIAEILTGL